MDSLTDTTEEGVKLLCHTKSEIGASNKELCELTSDTAGDNCDASVNKDSLTGTTEESVNSLSPAKTETGVSNVEICRTQLKTVSVSIYHQSKKDIAKVTRQHTSGLQRNTNSAYQDTHISDQEIFKTSKRHSHTSQTLKNN